MLRTKAIPVLCAIIVLAAIVAGIVGSDLSDRYSYETYDALVGGSGIVAAACAAIAMPWSRSASLPLAGVILVASLMAYARLGPPDPDAIDLTPLYLPPVIGFLGVVALAMLPFVFARTEPTSERT